MGEVGGVEPRGGCRRLVPVPPLPGETCTSTLFTDGFSAFLYSSGAELPTTQEVGVTGGIPDV